MAQELPDETICWQCGAPADPDTAAQWYRRSAEAGYFREHGAAVTTLFVEGTPFERGELDPNAPKRPVPPLEDPD